MPISSVRRAVITGCGVVSPLGNSVAAFCDGLLAGRSALAAIEGFDTSGLSVAAGGEVRDFDASEFLTDVEVRRLERIDQFALFAARAALADAGLDFDRTNDSNVGVIAGTTIGGMLAGEAYLAARYDGAATFEISRLLDFPYYALATNLARHLDVRGPVLSPSIACASGTQAIGMALEMIRAGHADVFVVGGAETLCRFVQSGFNCLRATTTETVRPFDARRSGLLMGEGAAMLVVEELDHARARRVRCDVEVAGTGLAGDATHMTAPARDGSGAARAIRAALHDAGIAPEAIDFISAHGTGTIYNDAMEVAAIASVFGEAAALIPVNSIKGSIGHTLGAAGSFEAIMCVDVLRHSRIPPTVGCEQVDSACPLDIVRDATRRLEVRAALSTSSAFAGNNASIVLRRVGDA
ncbi:MAG TPA: beta-ketoacyl-[acyl-carrier-protein] synthase family protein [Candidatus Acidoferrales bacterium]|nr:beta-ketoacyl-[acyl-carrier-protein] synthase family protein [Candidatus Acidoferrales bacterium]